MSIPIKEGWPTRDFVLSKNETLEIEIIGFLQSMGNYQSFEYEGDEEEVQLICPKLKRLPRRRWLSMIENETPCDFTICTNNILAPRYCYQQNYPFTDEKYLTGNYRFKKILQHLNLFQPIDIYCCQEVQYDVIEAATPVFEKEGYKYQYKQVTKFQAWNYQPNDKSYYKGHKEGVAIFYKSDVFDLLNVYGIEFNVEAFHEILNSQVDQETMKKLLYSNALSSHNVGLCCRMRHKKTNKTVLVCTVHAYFNYNNWVNQTYQMDNFFRKIHEIKEPYDGLIILGDFNAEPNSPTMEFVRSGRVNDFARKSGELIEDETYNIYKVLNREPLHNIRNLQECYPTRYKPITKQCHRAGKRKVLDYIWRNQGVEVTNVLEIPEEEFRSDFPNERIPSDHILIGSKLRFNRKSSDTEKEKMVITEDNE